MSEYIISDEQLERLGGLAERIDDTGFTLELGRICRELRDTRAGCKNCAALNKAVGLWAKADKRARDLERTCRFVENTGEGCWSKEYRDGKCSECGSDMKGRYNYCPNCGAKVVSE